MRLMRLFPPECCPRSIAHAFAALIVASTYFAFRVELFDDEVEARRHDIPCGLAFTNPTLSWETFDKENASQAFTIELRSPVEGPCTMFSAPAASLQDSRPFQPVRDKSPPSSPPTPL